MNTLVDNSIKIQFHGPLLHKSKFDKSEIIYELPGIESIYGDNVYSIFEEGDKNNDVRRCKTECRPFKEKKKVNSHVCGILNHDPFILENSNVIIDILGLNIPKHCENDTLVYKFKLVNSCSSNMYD
jgi:hypothetical protein